MNSSVEIFDFPVRDGKTLRTYDFILPKFHFIPPNPSFTAKINFRAFSRETWVKEVRREDFLNNLSVWKRNLNTKKAPCRFEQGAVIRLGFMRYRIVSSSAPKRSNY